MALYPLHPNEWLVGVDRRAPSLFPLGIMRLPAWASQNAHHVSSYRSDMQNTATVNRPLVTDDARDGVSYPVGTVFVIIGSRVGAPTTIRSVGFGTNPLTVSLGALGGSAGGNKLAYLWRAVGVPAGATGVITIKKVTAGTTVATIPAVTADGVWEMPEFVAVASPETYSVTSSWTGGVPRFETISRYLTYSPIPVPGTLPAGYTARQSSDVHRGGTFGDRQQGDITQLRHGPHITFENLGVMTLNISGTETQHDALAGVAIRPRTIGSSGAAGTYNLWIDGALWRYDLMPPGRGPFHANGSLPDWTGPGAPFFRPPWPSGINAGSVLIIGGTESWSLAVTVTDAATFQVDVWAGPLGSETLQSTGVYAAGTTTITPTDVQPAAVGDAVSILVKVYPPGTYWTGTCTAVFTCLGKCDIPLPYSVVSQKADGTVITAPGGYLPSKLGTPASCRTLVRLGAGVTSHSNTGIWETVVFLPAADGWYQVTLGGTPLTAIGESAFDHDSRSIKSVDRGHEGRPFHSKVNGAGTQTVALVAYTSSPAAIASGGTTLTLSDGSWWKWGSIAAPSAGTWRVTVAFANEAGLWRGLRVGWSLTDATVLDPTQTIEFQPFDMLYLISETYRGTSNAPPGSPALNDAWIIGTAPTGAWATFAAGTVVLWDTVANAWRPFVPVRGSYIDDVIGSSRFWYDGTAWKAATDPIFTFDVTTTGAQTISLVLGAISSEKTGTAGQVRVSWAAAP